MACNRTRAGLLPVLGFVAALAATPAAVAAEPPDADAARAEALWLEGASAHVEGRYEDAIKQFRRALALHPTGRAHTWLAWSLSELGDKQAAVRHCRRSIELDPDYPNAYNDIGSYLIDLGRPREAVYWLRQAIAFEDYCCPHYAWYHMGRALLLLGRPEAAIDALEHSVHRRPDYRPALELLALLRVLELRGA